jgi:hypothetical protein
VLLPADGGGIADLRAVGMSQPKSAWLWSRIGARASEWNFAEEPHGSATMPI